MEDTPPPRRSRSSLWPRPVVASFLHSRPDGGALPRVRIASLRTYWTAAVRGGRVGLAQCGGALVAYRREMLEPGPLLPSVSRRRASSNVHLLESQGRLDERPRAHRAQPDEE